MPSGGGSGFGMSISTTNLQSVGNLAPQPQPGAGCSSVIEANASSTSASASVGLISASGTTSSSNSKNTAQCAPDYINNQTTLVKHNRSTAVDKNTILINKNTIKAMSESVNQMVVNSITSTKSTASQNVTTNQSIKIKVSDVAKDVTIKNTGASATIDLTNIANMSFTAFDNVRTDLANDVLQQFKSNVNQESMATMQVDMETSIANQNDAAIKTKREMKVEQEQKTQLPAANPTEIVPINNDANVNINQVASTDITDSSYLSANYTNELSTDRIMETHVMNAVTQNFTKESLTQLSQIINSNQSIEIDVEGVGGNVTIEDTFLNLNIVLRQTLTSNMNVGTAVINAVSNTLGAQTDDSVITKNTESLGLTNKTDTRNGNTSKGDMESKFDYKQTISQDFGLGSCGSCASSCICCIICIVCILSSGLGAVGGSMGSSGEEGMGEESVGEGESPTTNASSTEQPAASGPSAPVGESSESASVGGYYYFD
jgi:hypothetical protein